MSTTSMLQALNAPADLRPTERLILAFLADDAASDGVAHTSVSRLAGRANVSTSTASSSLRRLGALGLLQPLRASTSSAWRLTLDTPTGGNRAETQA
ncbi:helix-turn-helix domain-containing protein [[Kitasatospora] papulosa]|uniref:helix-turn-helix domain-containing protein n=1 Tax=[Kitasatospora] papulosa TaxID=1464011 RepID=UPI0039083ECA